MKADLPSVDKAPGAGRPRDPRIDAAILTATADLLVHIGYSNLTLAAVAERAGTTKTALYRRWSSKAELVHEAAFPVAPSALVGPAGDVDPDRLIELIGGATLLRLLLRPDDELDDNWVDQTIAILVHGVTRAVGSGR
jgi:AcrR family transcriptional regulator